ncbi:phage tail sheath family protein [Cloacibacillus porcorum]|uniref:phage tail sheath family protein n=1 Tax=Cloacibacillus porcorum TaxID=1197717 RepID=UPI0026712CC4|nr:phage tail sheath family protein [Cloacibacillus porcorum]
MVYKHGAYAREVPTSILPPVTVDSALPVFIGTAPLHLSKTGAGEDLAKKVNMPILCYTYDEACDSLGFVSDSARWGDYTLSECIKAQYALFGIAPAIFINVLDPENTSHIEVKAIAAMTMDDKVINLGADVISSTVTVKASESGEALTAGTDYSVAYDAHGNCVINVLEGGTAENMTELYVGYTVLKPSSVSKNDIIGGYDTASGKYKGLELVNLIYPKYQLVPGSLVAPKFSQDSGVAAVMEAKAESISGCYKALALVDLGCGSDGALSYTEAPALKTSKNFVNELQVVSWPMATLGDDRYHLSVLLAGLLGSTDNKWNNIPVKSPSNMILPIDGICDAAGNEINLTQEQGNYLNGQGITTALNNGGWHFWGNRTGIYPSSTDPKDTFIPIRRMFNWISNTLITTWLQRVDYPIVNRTIETMVDSINIWLNGLAAQECLIGHPKVKFLESENPTTSLMDGIVTLHVYVTPPSPMRELDFVLEYDVSQIKSLFGEE